ncbi:hypothetical protein EMCG_02958 [[Emmonsia] crescens]|uniref:Uncharacterized protein n=1 Tax=[Emmonsia] crescens TaxID=73230 RepID=A0A0G2HWD4_9EURO|nr:hypothetical protein EMCG_02958 [Emmonsia crescens UAMH 3008]
MPADCFLEQIKEMLEKDPRIAGYLDHNPENIANAAKLIVERNHGQGFKFLAQAETRTTFEQLLHHQPSRQHNDDAIQQSAERVALAKKTLRNSGYRSGEHKPLDEHFGIIRPPSLINS